MANNSTNFPPPLGWSLCPLSGHPIPSSSFIMCKTPLNADLAAFGLTNSTNQSNETNNNNSVPAIANTYSVAIDELFTVQMFLRFVKNNYGIKVGLIIDLTDGKFYNGLADTKQENCSYINLHIKSNLPTSSDITAFNNIVTNYLKSHIDSYIAVHDIYGYNVSSYLIACYLVEINDVELNLVYQSVAMSRPPGLYDKQLLTKLYERYEEEFPFDLSIIQKPEWDQFNILTYTNSDGKKPAVITQQATNNNNNNNNNSNNCNNTTNSETTTIKRRKKAAINSNITAASNSAENNNSNNFSSNNSSNNNTSNLANISNDSRIDDNKHPLAATIDSAASKAASEDRVKRKQNLSQALLAENYMDAPPSAVQQPEKRLKPESSHSLADNSTKSTPSQQDLSSIIRAHNYLVAVKPPHLQRLQNIVIQLSLGADPTQSTHKTPQEIAQGIAQAFQYTNKAPLTLAQLQIIEQNREDYSLTWLPEATSCLLLVLKEGSFLCFEQGAVYHVPALFFPKRKDPLSKVNNTLCAAELLFDQDNGQRTPRLLISDCICFSNYFSLGKEAAQQRIQCADIELAIPRAQLKPDQKANCKLQVRCKKLFPLNKLNSVLQMPLLHHNQGVIIMPNQSKSLQQNSGEIQNYCNWYWTNNSNNQISKAILAQRFKV
jgi:hypothetical protein